LGKKQSDGFDQGHDFVFAPLGWVGTLAHAADGIATAAAQIVGFARCH
jgi:hypothetical protein